MSDFPSGALAALQTELEAPEYKGLSDAAAAALLNSPRVTAGASIGRDVATADVQKRIVPTGELYKITIAASANPPTEISAAAWSFSQMLGRFAVISTSEPPVKKAAVGAMAVLVSAGLLSEESKAAIEAMMTGDEPAREMHPRIVDVWVGIAEAPNEVTEAHVREARG